MNPHPVVVVRARLLVLAAAAALAGTPAARAGDGPPGIDAACAAVAAPAAAPVPGPASPGRVRDRTPEPPTPPLPAPRVAMRDPTFGSCIARITRHGDNPAPGFLRNDYSRRQAFNVDGSRFLLVAEDGSWHLHDGRTLAWLRRLPGLAGDAEPQWHPTDPRRLRFLPRHGMGMTIEEVDVEDGTLHRIADLGARLRALWPTAASAWTRSEGSPSDDHRTWAFLVETAAFEPLGIVTYDLAADRLIAHLDLSRPGGRGRPDHLSASPSGRHVVVSWLDGVVAYRADLTRPRTLQAKSEHSDLARDAAGDDVYVAVDYGAPGGPLFMVHLDSGRRTVLLDTYVAHTATALHVSGRASRRPGWVLLSTYADSGRAGEQWLHRKLIAVELKAGGARVGLAHHHSRFVDYWSEPHATVDRDFAQVLFNSNWGRARKGTVDAFRLGVPDGALVPAR